MKTAPRYETRVYLVSDFLIQAVVPLLGEREHYVEAAVKELARVYSTAYWLDTALPGSTDGYSRVEGSEAIPAQISSARWTLDAYIFASADAAEEFHTICDDGARQPDFTVTVVDAEAQYYLAMQDFRKAINECDPREPTSVSVLQNLRNQLVTAAECLRDATPSVDAPLMEDLTGLLRDSAWVDQWGKIESRIMETRISLFTQAHEERGRPVMTFKFRTRSKETWRDGLAWVSQENGVWQVSPLHDNWLHQRKIQLGLNDAQIDELHRTVERGARLKLS
jgi:hypothetical protein